MTKSQIVWDFDRVELELLLLQSSHWMVFSLKDWSFTWPPRLIRCALGMTSFISFANCTSLLLGSLEVVIRILGSLSSARAYSSSMWSLGTAVLSSSSSIFFRRPCSSLRNSVGMGLPSAWKECFQTCLLEMFPSNQKLSCLIMLHSQSLETILEAD